MSMISAASKLEISASVQKQLNQLTPEYRRLIINTFPAFNDSYGRNGMSFFARYFAEYPDYKNIWPNFRGVQDSAIVSSEQLRKHAIKFMHGLKEIVDNLESDEKLVETTKKICKKHVTLGVNRMHVEVS
ncbi:hypothetical protein WR25_01865 [Diploscapter pachys]|uniref:Globin domain-containing protein n=1 Tax=Diploscapter pachys TaxID=2018661 RepID=A0A2A2KVX1_9BILA|nr:hypothetical protein WR25_01865 [Diploscapter pachys]